ncbi:hypothetical protein [Rugosimonospora africana]|uniref:Uncharacterized protein n=1 Tax=Rugosimonospora africana TaxID=556532 RepID=A0A8J3QYU4_9ACTN|nr:hypothetical protein [Rugosimonospora africana]GIH18652.1 hypothetical protein Raf01_68240 [Rugosimonospora africana]
MVATTGRIEVGFQPSRVNGWFLKAFARPYVSVGGTEHAGSWSAPVTVEAPVGTQRVCAYVRYRGTRWNLGARPTVVDVEPGSRITLTARNGWANSSTFTLSPPARS